MLPSRHFIDVRGRRVHYRMSGEGPPLLMVHQSPRSSAEFEPLMARWSRHFRCIAPDTPGFGLSDPLPNETPDVADFAEALLETIGALGLSQVAAYGVHSGGMILMSALRRQPALFDVGAIAGYPVWTDAEMAAFGDAYLPPLVPSAYGEHLAWLWHRIVEQSWFFPWFSARPECRLPFAHNDLARIDGIVHEMLEAGDAYRAGYGAVLRAASDVPGVHEHMPPVLIAAFNGDPLQKHLARLGALPTGWQAQSVADRPALEDLALAHLRGTSLESAPSPAADPGEGFLDLPGGRLHWQGNRGAKRLVLHAPGSALLPEEGVLALDLPGHGLSGEWVLDTLGEWAEAIAAAVRMLGAPIAIVAGRGLSALLAIEVARRLDAVMEGEEAHIPVDTAPWLGRAVADVRPDRHGGHLMRAWSVARASQLFWPWFDAGAANAIPFDPAALSPGRLAGAHLDAMRARQGVELADLLLAADRDELIAGAAIASWHIAPWAEGRADVWRPAVQALPASSTNVQK